MKIHFCCFIYGPDFELYKLQVESIKSLNLDNLGKLFLFNESSLNERNTQPFNLDENGRNFINDNNIVLLEQPPHYTPFSCYNHCIAKINAYRNLLNNFDFNDEDFLVDIDSDVMFFDKHIFSDLQNNEFVGRLAADQIRYSPRLQKSWSQMSGVFLGMNVRSLKRITGFTNQDYLTFKQEAINMNLPFVHDCFTSYLMNIVCENDKIKNVPHIESSDYEEIFLSKNYENKNKSSLVHFSGWGNKFLGKELRPYKNGTNTRFDIPRIFKEMDIKV